MAYRWALYLMITTTAAYPAAPLDLPPLGQIGLTDASMNNNNNNNNNGWLTQEDHGESKSFSIESYPFLSGCPSHRQAINFFLVSLEWNTCDIYL